MLAENDVELEDLEAMLYNQVFHSSDQGDVESSTISNMDKLADNHSQASTRYFHQKSPLQQTSCQALPFETVPRSAGNQSGNTEFTLGDTQQNINFLQQTSTAPYVNNITINQYMYSPYESEDRALSELQVSWRNQNNRLLPSKNSRRKRKKRSHRKQQRSNQIQNIENLLNSDRVENNEVICLSDSDDCLEVPLISSTTKPNIESSVDAKDLKNDKSTEADDDDIIYVEPPPVPVINVDVDSDSEEKRDQEDSSALESSTSTNETIPESQDKTTGANLSSDHGAIQDKTFERSDIVNTPDSASHDFLESISSENQLEKFNFGLHGADFRNSQFVKPANPTDVYETESSTSTSDLNKDLGRDFNNTVKTIVFNEVEFPREDIFMENNLESFGSFITPKRVSKSSSKKQPTKNKSMLNGKTILSSAVSTSESSSESEYEEADSSRKGSKNLPNLCPIQGHNVEEDISKTPNKVDKKKRKSDEFGSETEKNTKRKKRDTRKKSRTSENEECHLHAKENEEDAVSKQQAEDYELTGTTDNSIKQLTNISQENEKIDVNFSSVSKPLPHVLVELHEDNSNFNDKEHVKQQLELAVPTSQETEDSNLSQADVDLQPTDKSNIDPDVIFIDKISAPAAEIISDSDGEYDTFSDVGDNMVLANTSNQEDVRTICQDTSDYSRFNVENMQKNMSDDPENWKIIAKDRLILCTERQKGPRCRRCRQFGHMAGNCPNKPDLPNCSLCGNPGHQEPRCPNKMCFQCGNVGVFSTTFCWKCVKFKTNTCTVCNTLGHNIDMCPDLWRRYHITTSEGDIVKWEGPQLKPRNDQWCAGCAQQGHLEYECENYCYNRDYPAVVPWVHNYDDVYKMCSVQNTPSTSGKINVTNINRNNFSSPRTSHTQFIPPLMGHTQFIPPLMGNTQFIPPLMGSDYNGCNNMNNLNQCVLNPFSMLMSNQKFKNSFIIDTTPSTKIQPINVEHDVTNNYFSFEDAPAHNYVCDETNTQYQSTSDPVILKRDRLFRGGNVKQLQLFLNQEISKLQNINNEVLIFKKKLFHAQSLLKKIKTLNVQNREHDSLLKRVAALYKQINMFIFGKCRFPEGKKNLNYLQSFLVLSPRSRLSVEKRQKLQSSYEYIFGGEKHKNTNYRKILQVITNKKSKRFL